jgi:hypothetical protein
MILERDFDMVRWRERKWNHKKRIFLKLKCFSVLGILTCPLFEETLGDFHYLPLFFSFFFFFNNFSLSSFFMLRLSRTWGVLMIFEGKNHFFKNFLFKWNGMVMTMEILTVDSFWNGVMNANIDVGVVDILAVDAYFRVEVCTSIFLGEASK